MNKQNKNIVSNAARLGYGIGALSYAVPFQLLSVYLMFYATNILGISGTATGLIISASTIWDAVTDPVMGYISDHTSDKIILGRRLFYVLLGAAGLALFNWLLWRISPEQTQFLKTTLLAFFLIMIKTFSTIYTTPFLAHGAELSNDYNERTVIQSYRTAFYFLGFIFPIVMGMAVFFRPTPEFSNGHNNPQAYQYLGLTGSALILVCAAVCIALTYRRGKVRFAPKPKSGSFYGIFAETIQALKCADFRNVSLSLMFVNMAMGIVGAAGMHVFIYTFGFSNKEMGIVFGSLFAAALLAQPLWTYVANRTEKRRALIICLFLNIAVSVVFAVCVLLSEWICQHYLIVLPLALLMGLSMGGSIALPYSMIADTIDKDAYHTGTRKEGVFFGCATLIFKISQAAAIMIVGLLIDCFGFNPKIVQPRSVYINIGLILPAGFFVCFVSALIFIKNYSLDRKQAAFYRQPRGADLNKREL